MIQCLSLAGHLSCLTNEHNMATVGLENFGVKFFVKLIHTYFNEIKTHQTFAILLNNEYMHLQYLSKCMLNVCDYCV